MGTGVSLNPEDFAAGGGLIDDVDVVLVSCLFDMFDYNGTVQPGVPSLRLELEAGMDENIIQFYSMGNANDWLPSDDGSQLVAVGKAANIRLTSNGGILLKSMIDAGFPAEKLTDDITILDGMEVHMIRVPAPERPGLKNKKEKKFEDTLLIVSEIKTLPWEKKAAKATTKAKPVGAPAAAKAKKETAKAKPEVAEEGDDAVSDAAVAAVLAILAEEGTITKKALPGKIFQTEKENPDRNAIVKLVFDDEFLGAGPWEYEDGVLVSS